MLPSGVRDLRVPDAVQRTTSCRAAPGTRGRGAARDGLISRELYLIAYGQRMGRIVAPRLATSAGARKIGLLVAFALPAGDGNSFLDILAHVRLVQERNEIIAAESFAQI